MQHPILGCLWKEKNDFFLNPILLSYFITQLLYYILFVTRHPSYWRIFPQGIRILYFLKKKLQGFHHRTAYVSTASNNVFLLVFFSSIRHG